MDIHNDTIFPTEARRECIADHWGHVVALTKVTYEVDDSSLLLSEVQTPIHCEPCAEAPTGEIQFMMAPGLVDIVCTGEIHPPRGEPSPTVDVRLRWHDEVRALRAFGRRVWQRTSDGTLAASPPEPFRTLPMLWSHAYGGTHRIPAGFAPGTRLPMPAGEVAWPVNRSGMGFYLDAAQAEGQPLPHLETPDHLISAWDDRPNATCFAPCPVDSSFRASHVRMDAEGIHVEKEHDGAATMARALRNAAPSLQARDVGPGTRFTLEGMSPSGPIHFEIPALNLAWTVTTGDWRRAFALALSAVHIKADEQKVALLLRADLLYPLIREQRRTARLHLTGRMGVRGPEKTPSSGGPTWQPA